MAISYSSVAQIARTTLENKPMNDPNTFDPNKWFIVDVGYNVAADEFMVGRLTPVKDVQEAIEAYQTGEAVVTGIDELDAFKNASKGNFMKKGRTK